MNGRRDSEWPRAASPGSPDGSDVLEHGSRRPPIRWRRPPRLTVILVAVALLAGLAGGYALGDRHARQPAPPSPAAAAAAAAGTGGYPVSQSGPGCSSLIGSDLQLGLQVTNTSATGMTLRRVVPVLPIGGLKEITQAWGTCGELPLATVIPGNTLAAGASGWFTVTFRVIFRGCPQPLPVQFTLDYQQRGREASIRLPGFPDLSQVPYPGCP